jgi:hypothetical protein
VAAAALAVIGVFVISACAVQVFITLLVVIPLLLLEAFRRGAVPGNGQVAVAETARPLRFLLGGLIMLMVVFQIMRYDLFTTARLCLGRGRPSTAYAVESDRFRDLAFAPRSDENGPESVLESLAHRPRDDWEGGGGGIYHGPLSYAVAANDGLSLLRRHVTAEDRLFVLDAYNPFTYALGLRHARGDAAWWHYPRIMDEHHCPPPNRALQDVTLVLWPKLKSKSTTDFMLRVYGPAVEAGYDRVDESTLYVLYRLKNVSVRSGPPAAPG